MRERKGGRREGEGEREEGREEGYKSLQEIRHYCYL